jgi:hypothetical protein
MWDEESLNLKFLLGKSVELSGIGVLSPLKIDEISNIGFELYNKYLSLICVSSDDICEFLDIWDDTYIEPFTFIIENCLNSDDFKSQIVSSLSLFLRTNIEFSTDGHFIIGDMNDGNFLHYANFNFFSDILKNQNCINKDNQNKIKPKNDAEIRFFKKLKEQRAKYTKKENDMNDIISAVCAKHPSINLFNVGNLTIYQIIDQYKRLHAIDEYFINIESLLHGASGDDVKITHWSSKVV